MSEVEFTALLKAVSAHAAENSIDGAIHYQCMDWRHRREMLNAGDAVYSGLRTSAPG
jgi:hypothetical protein